MNAITFRPLSAARWKDLEKLFGARGACGGCWCMYWRRPRPVYEAGKGNGNRLAFKKLVDAGTAHGLLAYSGREPVGWCAIGPRGDFPRLRGSRILKALDDQPVWSVTCFFVTRSHRRRGISTGLLNAAAGYASRHGARLIEGYPLAPRSGAIPDAFAWTGIDASFVRAGFAEAARRSPTRPIMRRQLVPLKAPKRPRRRS